MSRQEEPPKELLIEIFRNNWEIIRRNEERRDWYFNISSIILAGILSAFLMSSIWEKQLIFISLLSTFAAFVHFLFGSMILKINYDFTRVIYQTILLSVDKYDKYPDLIKYAHVPVGFLKDLFECEQGTERGRCGLRQILKELTLPKLSVAALTVSFYFYVLILTIPAPIFMLLGVPPKEPTDLVSSVVCLIFNIILLYLFVHRARGQCRDREEARKKARETVTNSEHYNEIIKELKQAGIC